MSAPHLIERDGELAAIDSALARLRTGAGSVLVVEGPAGIGKSRLAAAVRARATERGLRVLAARGGVMERDFPFGVVRQLLEGPLAEPGGERLLHGAARSAHRVLAPLGEVVDVEEDGSFAALHGLYWLVVNLAAADPVVVAVDDLHWCDRPSLRFLGYLTRRLEGLPVLVAVSLRPAEPGMDEALVTEVTHDPLAVRLRPAPLTPQGAAALIGGLLGSVPDPEFTAVCHEATGGNPLLLSEMLAAMQADNLPPDAGHAREVVRRVGPRAVSRAVLSRLSRLSGDAVPVAQAFAVLGDGADLRRVADLAGVGEEAAATAVASLARADILRLDPPLGFVHPLVRAAVYQDIPPGVREQRHAHAARLLADADAPDEQVAAHLLLTPPAGDGGSVAVLARAARVSLSRGAAESAVAYLTRALEEPAPADERPALLGHLGGAEGYFTGTGAAAHLRAAYRETRDPVERARVALALIQTLLFVGDPREVDAIAREAADGLGADERDLHDRLEAARLCTALYDPALLPLDSPDFLRHRRISGDAPGARMLAGIGAYQWAMTGGAAADCVPLALHAVGGGAMEVEEAVGVPTIAGVIVLALADHPAADTATQVLMDAAHRRGSASTASGAYIFRGLVRSLRGDLGEADRLLGHARDVQDAWGHTTVRMFPAAYHSHVLLERGDLARARDALDWARMPPDDRLPESANVSWWLDARARLALAEGDVEAVLRLTEDCARRFTDSVVNPAWVPWRSLRAEALVRAGRAAEALPLVDQELAHARRWDSPGVVGRTLRLRGVLRGEQGGGDLHEAVATLDASPAALDLARALGTLGTWLRHIRAPSEAREPLRRALELATACEATPLAEHLRTELQATGVRPRTTALAGPASLTASERRVADMAAEGRSNRDIAESLYVTPKTVEVHLSSAYRKLGIRSRRELPGALGAGAG